MMKGLFYIYLFCGLLACSSKITTRPFTDIASLIDYGKKAGKPSLVYLTSSHCAMCELMDYKIWSDERVKNYVRDRFIFYEINVDQELFFNRLLHAYGFPVVIILEGEEVKSLVFQSKRIEDFLYSLKNYRSEPLELSLFEYSQLKGIGTEVCQAIDEVLKVCYHREKGDWSQEELVKHLKNSIETCPYFYNRFLLAEMIKTGQPQEAEQLERELFGGELDPFLQHLFGEEMREYLNKQYHLDGNEKAEIEFEQLKVDLGELRQNDKVTHHFLFRNTSEMPLFVYAVNTSCGCTVAEWKQHPVLAGTTDSIGIEFTATSVGQVSKTINVITNARKKNTVLTIKATVK